VGIRTNEQTMGLKEINGNNHLNPSVGWWLTYPSEKYEFVSWDDDIPHIWKNKSHVPNHQPALNENIPP
jgi:hypothetical protein